MKKLHLNVFVLIVITLNLTVCFSQNVNPIKDYKSTFNPNVCDKLSRFLKENNTAMVLCVNFLKDDNLSIAKADLILRNSLGLHPLYAFESFTYLYTINGRKDMYYSLQKYLAPNELSNVDKCIVFAIKELDKENKIKETKRNEEIKENNERIKKAEQNAINNANNSLSGLFGSNSVDENLVLVDLNDYGKITYPNDSTDWNATELDERMDSVLKANNVFYKDNVGWVKKRNKYVSIANRVLLTEMTTPAFDKDIEGRITVNIRVNENGEVIQVGIGSPTDIADKEMRDNALNAAKMLKFNTSNMNSSGTVTYNFKLR
jgi:TonB family protein